MDGKLLSILVLAIILRSVFGMGVRFIICNITGVVRLSDKPIVTIADQDYPPALYLGHTDGFVTKVLPISPSQYLWNGTLWLGENITLDYVVVSGKQILSVDYNITRQVGICCVSSR